MWFFKKKHICEFKPIFKKVGKFNFNEYGDATDALYVVEECTCEKRKAYVVDSRDDDHRKLNPEIVLQKLGGIDAWEDYQAKQKLKWLEELEQKEKEKVK
jgi:hypothetical protein